MRPGVLYGWCLTVAALAGGCGWFSRVKTPWDSLKALQNEKAQMTIQMEKLQAENAQLKQQTETLAALDKPLRLEALDTLSKIRIGRYSGLYDKNGDQTPDVLAVYVEPLDTAQDYVKAAGSCTVTVWDLNAQGPQARLAEWTLPPSELHTKWGGTVFMAYYRLEFPVDGWLAGSPEELTIKVVFTDYLTGKVFSDQRVIKTALLRR